MAIQSVGCFCGAREGRQPAFRAAAEQLGQRLAERTLTLVYGGGGIGMMGALASAVLANGGRVVGVIPHGLSEQEFAKGNLTEMHRVDTMHQRKALMEQLSDAFIALPGGFGTLDELFEIATWSQLGLHHKPIGLLDTDGFWEGLLHQVRRAVSEGFIAPELEKLLIVEREPDALLNALQGHVPSSKAPIWRDAPSQGLKT